MEIKLKRPESEKFSDLEPGDTFVVPENSVYMKGEACFDTTNCTSVAVNLRTGNVFKINDNEKVTKVFLECKEVPYER